MLTESQQYIRPPEGLDKRLATFVIVQQSLIHFQLYNQAPKVENLLHTAER